MHCCRATAVPRQWTLAKRLAPSGLLADPDSLARRFSLSSTFGPNSRSRLRPVNTIARQAANPARSSSWRSPHSATLACRLWPRRALTRGLLAEHGTAAGAVLVERRTLPASAALVARERGDESWGRSSTALREDRLMDNPRRAHGRREYRSHTPAGPRAHRRAQGSRRAVDRLDERMLDPRLRPGKACRSQGANPAGPLASARPARRARGIVRRPVGLLHAEHQPAASAAVQPQLARAARAADVGDRVVAADIDRRDRAAAYVTLRFGG